MKEEKTMVMHNNRKAQRHEFKEVEETPFNICTTTIEESDEQGKIVESIEQYRVCVGNQALTEPFTNLKDAIDYIQEKPWKLITALTLYINKQYETKN